ncbi:hypothetical protein [Sphingorhabdus sp.]|uniref:hypothetical protein n=1 Tax=Sphingorhabdus sp. TaxID=1902408 RepID=UPI0038FC0E9F
MRGFWWKLLFAAVFALQANGASAQGVCNYSNPASPNYCTNADVSEQKARFRSLNDDFTTNATAEADSTWRDAEFDQMRSSLSGCASQPENVVGCQFQVYRKFADALEGRLGRLSKATSDGLSMPSPVLPAPDTEVAPDAAAEAQKAAQGAPSGINATRENSGSISVVDRPANVSSGPHFEKEPYSYRKLFISVLAGALLWIVFCGPLAFRAVRGYSGVTERKVLLVVTYFIVITAVSETIEFIYWILIWLPIAIWGPRITAYPIRRRLLKFYGFEGPDFDDEFDEFCVAHARFWAAGREGALKQMSNRGQSGQQTGGVSGGGNTHKKVGFCQGANGEGGNKSSHYLYRCGNCGHSGCTDRQCPNCSYNGTNCSMCNARANFTS